MKKKLKTMSLQIMKLWSVLIVQQKKARITMNRTITVTNPYSGESAKLNEEENRLYDLIKHAEKIEHYDVMQKGLEKFSRMNPSAYMTLLD